VGGCSDGMVIARRFAPKMSMIFFQAVQKFYTIKSNPLPFPLFPTTLGLFIAYWALGFGLWALGFGHWALDIGL